MTEEYKCEFCGFDCKKGGPVQKENNLVCFTCKQPVDKLNFFASRIPMGRHEYTRGDNIAGDWYDFHWLPFCSVAHVEKALEGKERVIVRLEYCDRLEGLRYQFCTLLWVLNPRHL